ncbi:MAG: FGGY-family carbohydrate kinase [Christensenella sp.]|nr:FGGY-family carbohydrate kinase [Christensenella sp.]
MLFFGLDLGTSGVKANIFDEKGNVVASSYCEYVYVLESEKRELDAENIWECTKYVLQEALKKCSNSNEIAALAVSSFGEAFVSVDEKGNIISRVMVGSDSRADNIYAKKKDLLDPEYIAENCGLAMSSTYSFAKILFIKNEYPKIYDKTKYFLLMEDFIYYKLLGEPYSEYSIASRTMLFNVKKKCWDKNLLDLLGIDERKFAPAVQSGTVLGTINSKVAHELGISPTLKVIAGGHDQPCCAAGGGNSKNDVVCSMGTSEALTPILEKPLSKETTLLYQFANEPYLQADQFCTMLYNPACGVLIKWFFESLCDKHEYVNGVPPYELYEKNAAKAKTKMMVLPYLCGRGTPALDNDMRMSFVNIDLADDRFSIYRAILEGMCFEQKYNLEILSRTGLHYENIIAVGGGTNSALWLQIKANILQMPIKVSACRESASLGCAMICAVALGVYADLAEAAENMHRIATVFEPIKSGKAGYDEKYIKFKKMVSVEC